MRKIFNLQNLAAVVVFLLPTYLMRFQVLKVPLNALDVLTGGFIILFFLVHAKKVSWKEVLEKYRAILILFGIILVATFLSSGVSGTLAADLGLIKSFLVLPFLFAFLAIQVMPPEKKDALLRAYYFSTLSVAVVALGYFMLGHVTYDGRLKAFFNSPNYLAMYLIPGMIIGVIELLLQETKKEKLKTKNTNLKLKAAYLSSLVCLAVVIYLTKSYAGWIALLLSLGMLLAIRVKGKIKLALLTMVAICLIFLQTSSDKFQSLVSFDERSSLASRVMIWRSSAKMLQDNWLWGVGIGNFQEKYLEYQKYFPPYLEWAVPHPHNLFLSVWLYAGVIGLVSFLASVVYFLGIFFKRQNKKTLFMSLFIVVYFLLHGLVDTTYFKNDLAVIFWLSFLLML